LLSVRSHTSRQGADKWILFERNSLAQGYFTRMTLIKDAAPRNFRRIHPAISRLDSGPRAGSCSELVDTDFLRGCESGSSTGRLANPYERLLVARLCVGSH